MRRSNAGSKLAARLVAKMTTPRNDSSSFSSTFTTAFASREKLWSGDVDRRAAMLSASSNSSTAFSSLRERNSSATFFGVSPTHIDSTSA